MSEVVPEEYSQTPPTATDFHFRFPRGNPKRPTRPMSMEGKKLCHKKSHKTLQNVNTCPSCSSRVLSNATNATDFRFWFPRGNPKRPTRPMSTGKSRHEGFVGFYGRVSFPPFTLELDRRNLFLWIENFISTTDLYNTAADGWSCHLPNRNKQLTCLQCM